MTNSDQKPSIVELVLSISCLSMLVLLIVQLLAGCSNDSSGLSDSGVSADARKVNDGLPVDSLGRDGLPSESLGKDGSAGDSLVRDGSLPDSVEGADTTVVDGLDRIHVALPQLCGSANNGEENHVWCCAPGVNCKVVNPSHDYCDCNTYPPEPGRIYCGVNGHDGTPVCFSSPS